jgi:hypothetical protein
MRGKQTCIPCISRSNIQHIPSLIMLKDHFTFFEKFWRLPPKRKKPLNPTWGVIVGSVPENGWNMLIKI